MITLYNALRITEQASPAEISCTVAPSFCACFTLEFIKTVHLVPRSIGWGAKRASFAKSAAEYPSDWAKFSIKEPQPEEQASFRRMLSTEPFFSRMHFMSCPPMSSTQSTSGSKKDAAVQWAMVSTSPSSSRNAVFSRLSPYPVEQERTMCTPSGSFSFSSAMARIAAWIGEPWLLSYQEKSSSPCSPTSASFVVVEPASMPRKQLPR